MFVLRHKCRSVTVATVSEPTLWDASIAPSIGARQQPAPAIQIGQCVRVAEDAPSRRRKVTWVLNAQPGYLDGLDLAPPDVQDLIRHRARWQKHVIPPPFVVLPEQFVDEAEAKRLLQRRGAPWPSFKHAIADGLVEVVYRSTDGEEGLSRSSVAQEMQWRRTATRFDRIRRRLRLLARLGWSHPPAP